MLGEGIDPAIIEQAGTKPGYPAPKLQLADELNFTTMNKIQGETRQALLGADEELPEALSGGFEPMIYEHGRTGKLGGAGFYDYVGGKRARLWPRLRETFSTTRDQNRPFEELKERFLFAQALETQRVFDDGVVDSDADIGSIFAIGYPAWTGGVRQFIWAIRAAGTEAFVQRADGLAAKYGSRFEVLKSLR